MGGVKMKLFALFLIALLVFGLGSAADVKLIGNDGTFSSYFGSGGYLVMQQFVASDSGILHAIKISVYSSGHAMVAIYSDSAGSPATRLDYSASTAVTTGWNTITMTRDVSIVSGTKYWLAYNTDCPPRDTGAVGSTVLYKSWI
jgi:hypothetical protein